MSAPSVTARIAITAYEWAAIRAQALKQGVDASQLLAESLRESGRLEWAFAEARREERRAKRAAKLANEAES